ncbi:MAG: DUF3307 domain-containing protein [Nitrospira sp.]|nr:DUF3307 domain-containing protein [Nitrospira sp.]
MFASELIFATIVAHYIGDFSLQGNYLAKFKGKSDYVLFGHALIWAGCISAVLSYFGVFAWWKVAFLVSGHFIIDRWKARKKDKSRAYTYDLWIDQSLHFLQLLVVSINVEPWLSAFILKVIS